MLIFEVWNKKTGLYAKLASSVDIASVFKILPEFKVKVVLKSFVKLTEFMSLARRDPNYLCEVSKVWNGLQIIVWSRL